MCKIDTREAIAGQKEHLQTKLPFPLTSQTPLHSGEFLHDHGSWCTQTRIPHHTRYTVNLSEDYGVLQLMDLPNASEIFPSDVIARAKRYLAAIGSTGAYSDSLGAAIFREDIAGALLVRPDFIIHAMNSVVCEIVYNGVLWRDLELPEWLVSRI